MKKRLISGLLALMMMVTLLPSGLFGVSAADEPNLTPDCVVYDADGNVYDKSDKATIDLQDGEHDGWVRISKTAVRSADDPNEYTITLSAEGNGVTASSPGADIVLVLDCSNSMSGSMESMQEAAKNFVDTVLTENSTNRGRGGFLRDGCVGSDRLYRYSVDRVAVDRYWVDDGWFSGHWEYVYDDVPNGTLKETIDGLSVNGGTNTQAGIYEAEKLLATSDSANKIIVLLSDGEPTYSYPIEDFNTGDWDWTYNRRRDRYEATASYQDYLDGNKIKFTYSGYDGDGGDAEYEVDRRVNRQDYRLYLNSAYAAQYEAQLAKKFRCENLYDRL